MDRSSCVCVCVDIPALLVLTELLMRVRHIDSSVLAPRRLIHNLGLPHFCTRTDTHSSDIWPFHRQSGHQRAEVPVSLTSPTLLSSFLLPLIPQVSTFRSIVIKQSRFGGHECAWRRRADLTHTHTRHCCTTEPSDPICCLQTSECQEVLIEWTLG